MKQQAHHITLGVRDLEKSKAFYEDVFGWKRSNEEEGIVFFQMNGFVLGLYPEDELAKDATVSKEGSGFKKFALSINFHSEQEVDEAFAELKEKGITVLKEPQKVFWGGYSGYVSDIDDNLWEITYNPFLKINDEGCVVGDK